MFRQSIIALCLVTASAGSIAKSPIDMLTGYVEQEVKDRMQPSAREATFAPSAAYKLCFVPDGASCEKLLIDSIRQTQRSLLIQAYSFTNPKIADAVKAAKARGVDVRVIVDKSQATEKYTSATFLKHGGVPVVVDSDPAIAHNKIMIFDQAAVFTGSFNFSRSAQERNAENGIVISGDANVVKAYTDNWTKRYRVSSPY